MEVESQLDSFLLKERNILFNAENFMKWCNLVKYVFNPLRKAKGISTIEISPKNWRREEPDQPNLP